MPTSDDHTPEITNLGPHPWRRFVALGDSFTEGIGDPEPASPDGNRGWADRVAEVLSRQVDDFAYANLAVRGKLIAQIVAGQVDAALELKPDLITFSAGGNDVIRPGTDPDEIAAQFEDAVVRLRRDGATLVVFTGIDTFFTPVFRGFRGKVAIYNENIRAIAERHDCIVADQCRVVTRFPEEVSIALPVNHAAAFTGEIVHFTDDVAIEVIEPAILGPILFIGMTEVPFTNHVCLVAGFL